MGDLKNKFMDILFEDDPEDMINDGKTEVTNFVDAKELLYRKPETSAFIDLDEKPAPTQVSKTEEAYEFSSQISPIFGVIKEGKKKEVNVAPEITESQTTKPADAHLDIITSPIYGYGSKEEAMDNNYDVKGINDNEDDELHQLFDASEEEESNLLSEDAFDEEEISLFRLFGDNK